MDGTLPAVWPQCADLWYQHRSVCLLVPFPGGMGDSDAGSRVVPVVAVVVQCGAPGAWECPVVVCHRDTALCSFCSRQWAGIRRLLQGIRAGQGARWQSDDGTYCGNAFPVSHQFLHLRWLAPATARPRLGVGHEVERRERPPWRFAVGRAVRIVPQHVSRPSGKSVLCL